MDDETVLSIQLGEAEDEIKRIKEILLLIRDDGCYCTIGHKCASCRIRDEIFKPVPSEVQASVETPIVKECLTVPAVSTDTNSSRCERIASAWNHAHPVGTPVMRYKLIHPVQEGKATKTRSVAWVIGGHSVLVKVEGVSGGVLLESVEVIQAEEPRVGCDACGTLSCDLKTDGEGEVWLCPDCMRDMQTDEKLPPSEKSGTSPISSGASVEKKIGGEL